MPDSANGAPQLLVHTAGATRLLPDGDRVSYTVGRDGNADFALADPRVSWEHALLRADGTLWVLEDLGSRNGTYAASARVTRLEITGPSEVHFGKPEDGPVMLVLPVTSVREHDCGIGLEHWRYGRRDGQARGGATGDPGHLGIGPDAPCAAVSGPANHAVSLVIRWTH